MIKQQVLQSEKLSKKDVEKNIIYDEICRHDPYVWGQFFFKHHFPLESPPFHIALIDSAMQVRHLAVAAPRESSKSTILAFLYVIHAICYKRKKFILIISNTFKKSAMSLETIKKEIRSNDKIKQSYPGIEVIKDAEGDSVIRYQNHEVKILCKGVDQLGSVRGVKFGEQRPDLILGDDMEDDELVKNPQRRSELQTEFDEALIPAGDFKKCQYIFVGTILHDDCLLSKLVSKDHYTEYKKLFYQAGVNWKRNNECSIWPEKWSLDELKNMERLNPSKFAKEMQNDPVSGRNVRFKKEDFRYWKLTDGKYICFDSNNEIVTSGFLSDCKAAIACDLAWKDNREADASVLMPGYLTPDSMILIDNYICKKGMRPNELMEQLFIMNERLTKLTGSTVPIGFEKAMLENVTKYLLKGEMQERNQYMIMKELVWDHDKQTRIEIRLEPRYSQHVIFHKHGMGDLEHELTRFPYGTHDDMVDCLQGLVQLLQVPKTKKKEVEQENQFMAMRRLAIEAKNPKRKPITRPFRKSKFARIPARESIW